MRTHTHRCLAALLLTCTAARADFQNGQPAVLALGEPALNKSFSYANGVAVDAGTHKVFVSDAGKHRVLRFSSAESLQNGGAAEAVLGQPDFQSTSPGLSATRLNYPQALAVSPTGQLWVADATNNRVLRFDHAATLASGSPADGVLGQVDFTHSGQNNASSSNMHFPSAVAVDPTGRLWVADTFQHRVLRFDLAGVKPSGSPADGVLGQASFTTETAATSATGLNQPRALAVDGTLRLWVADVGSNRVLLFNNPATKPAGAPADKVLGQPDFLSFAPPASTLRNRFDTPLGLAASGGTLWVADRESWRVLRFDTAHTKSNGANADGVLGQSSFTTDAYGSTAAGMDRPEGLALDGGRLWIVDSRNNRILRHENAAFLPNGSSAVNMLGDVSLIHPQDVSATRLAAGAKGITVDPSSGKVFVCDTWYHRVLRFASGAALNSGAAAEGVLGQDNFGSGGPGSDGADMRYPGAVVMDHSGHLWVADTGNNRVLRFDTPASAENGRGADAVLGQGLTSFDDNLPATTAAGMSAPAGLAVQSSFNRTTQTWTTTQLWVADTGNSRVLRFSNPATAANGASASAVLGQANFTSVVPGAAANSMNQPIGLAVDGTGHLWVADSPNHRVLRFDSASTLSNGASASGLLLQLTYGFINAGGPTASLGKFPVGVCVSPQGRLFVTESGSNRTVWFNDAANRPNGSDADGVIGANSLLPPNTTTPGYWNNFLQPSACTLDDAGHLWVLDAGQKRALRFTPALDSTITTFGLNAQNRFTLTMSALVGESYELRSSPDLLDWSTIEGNYRATVGSPYGVLNWTAPTAAAGKRFYRLQAP